MMFCQIFPWIFVQKYNFEKHFYSKSKTVPNTMVQRYINRQNRKMGCLGKNMYKLHNKVFNWDLISKRYLLFQQL